MVSATQTLAQCSGDYPCFDYTFSLVLQGPLERIFPEKKGEEARFLQHYDAGGFDTQKVIELGRNAARFYKERFGLDFTGLSSDLYLRRGAVIDGVASFRPFTVDPKANYRLISATRKDRVQFFNKRVDFGGWLLKFDKDFVSRGTFRGTVPKDGLSVVGSYVIRPCEGVPYGTCENILQPGNPAKPMFMSFNIRDFLPHVKSGESTILDIDVQSSQFGKGRGLGILKPKADGSIDAINTLIFPSNIF